MPMDREKPLAPNVKGEPTHKPWRRLVDGVYMGEDVVQNEYGFRVTYHKCWNTDVFPAKFDLSSCLVTWE